MTNIVDESGKLVVNLSSGCIHKVLCYDPDIPEIQWRSGCKWYFAAKNVKVVDRVVDVTEFTRCQLCWPSSSEVRASVSNS